LCDGNDRHSNPCVTGTTVTSIRDGLHPAYRLRKRVRNWFLLFMFHSCSAEIEPNSALENPITIEFLVIHSRLISQCEARAVV
jgi:hypothetical protein